MLPNWITQDENNPARFIVDADQAYARVISDLRVEQLDQYWLEVAHNVIKLDTQVAIAQSGLQPEGCVTVIIRGAEGYKDRWGWRAHPPGKHAELRKTDENLFARTVAVEARAHYKRLRGFVPA